MRNALRFLDRAKTREAKVIHKVLWQKVKPQVLVAVFEEAVESGRVSRYEATQWEEAVLAHTRIDGGWG